MVQPAAFFSENNSGEGALAVRKQSYAPLIIVEFEENNEGNNVQAVSRFKQPGGAFRQVHRIPDPHS